ncbi:FGGY-family carbohydrate kinase [Planctomycetota bacterium]
MSNLLGIDAGTTAMKAIVYDQQGLPLASGSQEYDLLTQAGGIVETDPEIYWSSLKSVLGQIFSQLDQKDREITALAISSQGESFITIDKEGTPLRNTIVWLDSRSQKEASLIEKEFGAEHIYHTTGSPEVDTTWASTKLLWMKRNEPELFRKIYKVLFVEDFLIYRLTGQFAANGALYCSSLLFDINKNIWWQEMLSFIGLSSAQLPELYPSGVEVATVKDSVADELGFSNKPIVVTGGMDQACGCIGTGNIACGIVTENTGSSLNISATIDKPVFDPLRRVPCQTHAISGKYIYLPWCTTAGMALKWFRDNFCEDQIKQAQQDGEDVYNILTRDVHKIPPGSEGLVVLPHLSGAMSPEMDGNARGVIFGLSLSTTRDHVVRAFLESIAYMSRTNIELLEETGIEVKEIILSGGASNSKIWNQIKADVLGKKVKTTKDQESCCLGAAILAGLGAGIFKSAEEACKSIITDDADYIPDKKATEVYHDYYDIYKQLYLSLKPSFKKTAQIEDERS